MRIKETGMRRSPYKPEGRISCKKCLSNIDKYCNKNDYFLRDSGKIKHEVKNAADVKGIQHYTGFPNWGRLVGGQSGQNGQKLHENDKIDIFGSKQWEGTWGGKPIFWVVGGGDRPSPPD